jgi:signal transduction histidine kinase
VTALETELELIRYTSLVHEIKNPAAVALAHVNLLRADDSNLNHHLCRIEQALTDICDLAQEMLSPNHDEINETNLQKILSEILETYRDAYPKISFAHSTNGELLCLGNETSLRMIFSNLIKNSVEAIEAEKKSGEIKITASCEENFLNITITDNGNFKCKKKPHGNGLGLAICGSLANGLGAKLSAHTHPHGCAVTVTLRTRCPSFA